MRATFRALARKTTFGRLVQGHADRVLKYTSTEEKNSDAGAKIAGRDVNAIGLLNFGTWFFRSLTMMETEHIPV